MQEINPDQINITGTAYLHHLETCLPTLYDQKTSIEKIFSKMCSVNNIHVFGFGRSGTAALAFAIRLRHFSAYVPPVWWIGDQVRELIRKQDLVILFSQSGTRNEVALIAEKAHEIGATIALITAEKGSKIATLATMTILLPRLDEPFVYGGGDFELSAWYLQEVLVSLLGTRLMIPPDEVDMNHI